MNYSYSTNQLRKICALVASAVILQVTTWAYSDRQDFADHLGRDQLSRNRWDDHDSFKESRERNDDHDRIAARGDRNADPGRSAIPAVPEVVNTAWLLLPLFGAVLVFSARRFLRSKA